MPAGAADDGRRPVDPARWRRVSDDEEHIDARSVDEACEMVRVLERLPTADPPLDRLFISPALVSGACAPGDATGRHRTEGEVALTDEGRSPASVPGADFELAVVDLAEGDRSREHAGLAH